jgi:hypothetical protein
MSEIMKRASKEYLRSTISFQLTGIRAITVGTIATMKFLKEKLEEGEDPALLEEAIRCVEDALDKLESAYHRVM